LKDYGSSWKYCKQLFKRRKDLFTSIKLVFFDTTSRYFEGEGGDVGEYGFSKDHRPDLHQKEVKLDGRRLVICFNPAEAVKDAKDREPVIASLKDKLKQGAKTFRRREWRYRRQFVRWNRQKNKVQRQALFFKIQLSIYQRTAKYKCLRWVIHPICYGKQGIIASAGE